MARARWAVATACCGSQDRQHIDEINVDAPEPAGIVQCLDQPLGVAKMGERALKFPQVK